MNEKNEKNEMNEMNKKNENAAAEENNSKFFEPKYIFFIIMCFALSLILALSYVTLGQFRDSNSMTPLLSSGNLLAMSIVKVAVFTVISGLLLSALSIIADKKLLPSSEIKKENGPKILAVCAFLFFLIAYLPWITLNFPGSANPDTELQLKMYLAMTPVSNWQPVLSTAIIGLCYSLGQSLSNPSLGFVIYEALQTAIASAVFSYAVYKLRKIGLPVVLCIVLVLYFALFPVYGGFAQWVEKDFLFASMFLLQTILLIDIIHKKECRFSDMLAVLYVSILCAFLRNNGIHAAVPSLFALIFFLKKMSRLRAAIAFVILTAGYIFVLGFVYPKLSISNASISETIGFMFQQTARYVNSYPDEVTEEEKAVLEQNFQDYDNLKNYDPVISDPVKIYYNHTAPKEYFKVWLSMFKKHPNAYIASYLNGAYGYLAPVKADTGAYIMTEYDSFLTDELNIKHTVPRESQDILITVLNSCTSLPVLKILAMPGLYTWLLCIMLLILLLNKKGGETIAFIPSIVTVLVCTVSPLACAMRYALPFVMCAPVLLCWCYTLFRKSPVTEQKTEGSGSAVNGD